MLLIFEFSAFYELLEIEVYNFALYFQANLKIQIFVNILTVFQAECRFNHGFHLALISLREICQFQSHLFAIFFRIVDREENEKQQ